MYRRIRNNSRRSNRRNRNRRNTRNNSNIFKTKAQRVSNRPFIKPRRAGFGTIATNTTRRIVAYPSSGVKPNKKTPAPASSWWLDKLDWFASLALQLLGVFLNIGDENTEKFCLTGAASCLMVNSSFVLQSSPFSTVISGKQFNIPFEQYRIVWIKFYINPIVDLSRRGGSYACAVIPLDDNAKSSDIAIDFESVLKQPGSLVKPIDRASSVSWSPNLLEYGMRWHDLSANKAVCAFVISFSDLALNNPDYGGTSSEEFTPQKAGFELIVESRVEVRRPGVSTLDSDMIYSDPTIIKINGSERSGFVSFSDVTWRAGVGHISPENLIQDFSDMHSVVSLE